MLYLIPTPVGNLEDITLRAIRLLKEVDLILAEDTRTTKKLLTHFEIDTPLRSYHIHNEHKIQEDLLARLETGASFALVTDAGTPGISDPGFLLVRSCVRQGVKVVPLPGATAFVPALVASGIPCDKFYFEGFLPHKKGKKTRLDFLAALPNTFVLYESPHRIQKTLEQLSEICGGDRLACVAREISKLHEEIVTLPLAKLVDAFKGKKVKGELVVVVAGHTPTKNKADKA